MIATPSATSLPLHTYEKDTLTPFQSAPLDNPTLFQSYVKMIEILKEQYIENHPEWVKNAVDNDPVLKNCPNAEQKKMLLPYPGLTAMAAHEEAHRLYNIANHTDNVSDAFETHARARYVSETAKTLSGIDIHPGAVIDPDFFVDHGTGVVIGETAMIGKGVFSLHGVTLGGSSKNSEVVDEDRPDIKRRHPRVGDNVVFGSNVRIYGPCTIDDGATISVGATIMDCNIGKNVTIGAGVSLYGVNIPDNAQIYNETPRLVVSEAQYINRIVPFGKKNEGKTLEEVNNTPLKQVRASEFRAPDTIIAQRSTLERLFQQGQEVIESIGR